MTPMKTLRNAWNAYPTPDPRRNHIRDVCHVKLFLLLQYVPVDGHVARGRLH